MNERVQLAHGNGGRLMRELIENLIAPCLSDVLVDTQNDATSVELATPIQELTMTSDGFTVQPLEFPGGNIGDLAIHGTVNDLAVVGAQPLYLSLNLFLEEGLPFDTLIRVLHRMRESALNTRLKILCGDTKVLPKGEVSGMYIATTGVGLRDPQCIYGMQKIKQSDCVLVSGPVGDHGVAVMFAREQFGLRGDLQSDCASVLPLTRAVADMNGVRFMRDPTRGGLATVLHEIQRSSGLGIRINQTEIPIRDSVVTVCDMLGYDPLYLACEGRVVAVVAKQQASDVLYRWRQFPQGKQAAIIGTVVDKIAPFVTLTNDLGGERILEELEDDPLPRIC